ncbi:MAG: N-acetylmuramoyl-L-alanine amidase [Phormidesmis sp.]
MRLNRLLPGATLVGALLLSLPAEAAIQSWQSDSQESQLTFTTEDDVQPTTQLLSNPPHGAIDLLSAPTGSDVQLADRPASSPGTRIQGITATADGFFIRTEGETPRIRVNRFAEGRQRYITLTFEQTALAPSRSRLPVNRYSISSWEVEQVSSEPASVNITLALAEESPDWDISASPDGVVILPKDMSISAVPDNGSVVGLSAASTPPATQPSTAARQIASDDALPTLSNGRFTVVIDPGHGGRDPGAVGIGGLQEKVVVNDISPRVAAILRQQGVNVVMTRTSDVEVDLEPRVATAERANASIFVSIHANAISMSRPDVNGLETFYASSAGQRLANTVHATVLGAMGLRDRRVRSARFYVIRQTSMPAILIETGFVTGAEDAPNLADPAWRERMAQAIAQGILIHLERGL